MKWTIVPAKRRTPNMLKLKIYIACTAWLWAMISLPADVQTLMIAGIYYTK